MHAHHASSETQGQLVGRMLRVMRYFWAKVYIKSRRAPGQLHLQNHCTFRSVQFSPHWLATKVMFWPISKEVEPDDSVVLLHAVATVFLIDHWSWLARPTGRFLGRVSEEILIDAAEIASCNVGAKKRTILLSPQSIFRADLSKVYLRHFYTVVRVARN